MANRGSLRDFFEVVPRRSYSALAPYRLIKELPATVSLDSRMKRHFMRRNLALLLFLSFPRLMQG